MKHGPACTATLTALVLCSCGGQLGAVSGSGGTPQRFSHPGLATSQSAYLEVYRATPEGLLVSGLFPRAPVNPDRDPGLALRGLAFTADASVHGSYFWKFADGVTLLDGTCQRIDKAGLLAAAARPGAVSVQFATFLYADQRPWAPPSVHVFSRTLHEPTDCSSTIFADPAFAPKG